MAKRGKAGIYITCADVRPEQKCRTSSVWGGEYTCILWNESRLQGAVEKWGAHVIKEKR